MESVTWTAVQDFIAELNRITGEVTIWRNVPSISSTT